MEITEKKKDNIITEVTITFQADTITELKDSIWDLSFKYNDMIVAHASGACGSHTIVLINPDSE